MAKEPTPDPSSPGSSDKGGGGATPKPERDFGDSAGYGSGGSTLDHRDVGDEGASDTAHRHNPLDDVMDTKDANRSS